MPRVTPRPCLSAPPRIAPRAPAWWGRGWCDGPGPGRGCTSSRRKGSASPSRRSWAICACSSRYRRASSMRVRIRAPSLPCSTRIPLQAGHESNRARSRGRDQQDDDRLVVGQLPRLTARRHDVQVVLEALVTDAIPHESGQRLQQIRPLGYLPSRSGFAAGSPSRPGSRNSAARWPLGTTRLSSDWPRARIRKADGTLTHQTGMLRVGDVGDLDDVVLDHDGIPSIPPQDALPLTHPPPAAEAPARQAAEQECQQGFDSPSTEIPCNEVEHRSVLGPRAGFAPSGEIRA